MAVDNLVEGLAATGVKPLRVAFGGKVKPSLFEHTLDYKLDRHPLRPEADRLAEEELKIQKSIGVLDKTIHELDISGRHQSRLDRMKSDVIVKERHFNAVRSRKFSLKQRMLRDILSDADVVRTIFNFDMSKVLSCCLDLHYMYNIGSHGTEYDRFPCRVSGRGLYVNGTCVFDTHHERGNKHFYCYYITFH